MNENKNLNNSNTPKEKNAFLRFLGKIGSVFKTLGSWLRRAFFGASKTLDKDDPLFVEKLESPAKIAVKEFFRRKLQVSALIVLGCLFLFVFIGPLIVKMDITADTTQMNMAPNLSLRSVPAKLKKNIKSITAYSTYSIGVSEDNEIYVWGASKAPISKEDFKNLPAELNGKKVAFAAAGKDHAIAITTEGKVVGWGQYMLAQYGNTGSTDDNLLFEPQELIDGNIDVANVKSLSVGNQATAIVMNDGSFYIWGNKHATNNIIELYDWQKEKNDLGESANVEKIVFGNSHAICLLKDGTLYSGDRAVLSIGEINMTGKKVVDIACDSYSVGAVFEDGTIMVTGVIEYKQTAVPELPAGEKYIKISGGSRHYAAVTDQGHAYTWGSNFYKQSSVSGISNVTDVYAVNNQTYFVNNGKLVKSCGLRGFIMGTDGQGRDLFARIVHGGKMTMTIGAVAVIISTIIAIIVGCVSGYFGKWVDMLLMRVTEIFSALPFLPFAMMLSVVISTHNVSENKRIFIIMVILGFLSWTGLAHMIRGQVLAEREKEFVIAAKAMGVKEGRIAFKHILPNVISIILVSVTLDFAGCMLTESGLSYLGFGVQQPQPTWGNLLNGANNSIVIKFYWWQWLFPAVFLGIATICVNIIGDGLRDVLDPKSSNDR